MVENLRATKTKSTAPPEEKKGNDNVEDQETNAEKEKEVKE